MFHSRPSPLAENSSNSSLTAKYVKNKNRKEIPTFIHSSPRVRACVLQIRLLPARIPINITRKSRKKASTKLFRRWNPAKTDASMAQCSTIELLFVVRSRQFWRDYFQREKKTRISVNACQSMCSRRSDAFCLWHSIRVLLASLSHFANGVNVLHCTEDGRMCETQKAIYWFKTFVSALAGECVYLCCALRACRAYI